MPAELTRFSDWDVRLHRLIDERRHQPFAWGSHDCGTWLADCILAMTGTDVLGGWRGRWTTRAGARRAIAGISPSGSGDLIEAVSALLGEGHNPLLARRGDALILPGDRGSFLAVCLGAVAAGPGEKAIQFLPMVRATHCWRIG